MISTPFAHKFLVVFFLTKRTSGELCCPATAFSSSWMFAVIFSTQKVKLVQMPLSEFCLCRLRLNCTDIFYTCNCSNVWANFGPFFICTKFSHLIFFCLINQSFSKVFEHSTAAVLLKLFQYLYRWSATEIWSSLMSPPDMQNQHMTVACSGRVTSELCLKAMKGDFHQNATYLLNQYIL